MGDGEPHQANYHPEEECHPLKLDRRRNGRSGGRVRLELHHKGV